MSSALGLNDHHQANVLNYMRFARYQRGQRLRCVDGAFQDLKESYLNDETTFTVDEVIEMLDGLQANIRTEVEAELINTAHTNVLLLRQLFQQSEKWHLKLAADISELENRELLDQIRQYEESQFSGTRDDQKPILEPLNETGTTSLLKMEIGRLQEDNGELARNLRQAEEQVLQLSAEKARLFAELDRAVGQGTSSSIIKGMNHVDAGELEKQMAKLRVDLSKKADNFNAHDTNSDLANVKHELLKVRAMLELAEKELETKVSQTTPFKNLQQMMQKKNDQIKQYRRQLAKYEEQD